MENTIKYILAILIITGYACNNNSKTGPQLADTSVSDTLITAKIDTIFVDTVAKTPEIKEETEISFADSIDFKKYEVGPQERIENAPIDWSSYPEARDFRTRITEAYKDSDVNFGGHYVTSIFGCGASCIMGFMVDVRDGKIYDLPLGEENSCLFAEDRALGNATSRLFIAGVCKENLEAKQVYYKAYLWDEDKKEFEKIEAAAFLKKT